MFRVIPAPEDHSVLAWESSSDKGWLDKEHVRVAFADRLPKSRATFMEAFQTMDVRQQKAQLQTILRAVTIYSDGRIEPEFRE